MNRSYITAALISIALIFSSCAKAPQAGIDAANVSIEAAKMAGADRYAPESFNAATEALKTAVTAIEEQNSKFVLFRNYDAAETTLASVSTLATKAIDETTAKKAALKAEVTQSNSLIIAILSGNKELFDKALYDNEGNAVIESPRPSINSSDNLLTRKDTILKRAAFGVSYDNIIPMEETGDLRVMVLIDGSKAIIKSNIRKIEEEEHQFVQADNNTSTLCVIDSIAVYSKLKISLSCDSGDFTIKPIETEEEQMLDFVNGNYWHWKLRAVSKTPHTATITMHIDAIKPSNVRKDIPTQDVKIEIVLSNPKTVWSKIWDWILESINRTLFIAMGVVVTVYLTNYINTKWKNRKRGAR